ncbi:MAG: DUF6273 domain-containing protein, partial [Propionibacteriaceae bacterium]|jgi:hypothetical protein|nr:DUF6273 domain-containing protein [Propionibacteriaceae bacterium]
LAPLKTCYRAAFDYLRRHHDDRPGLLESLLSTYDGDPLDATVREIVFQGQGRRYIDHVRSQIEAAGLVIDRDLAEAYFKLAGSAGGGQAEKGAPGGPKRGPRSRPGPAEERAAAPPGDAAERPEEIPPAPSRGGRPAGGVPQRTVDVTGLVRYKAPERSSEAAVQAVMTAILDSAPEPSRSAWRDTGLAVELSGWTWRVLAVDGDPGTRRALLLADGVVGRGPYHRADEAVVWADSDLRAWLNSEFLAGLGKAVVDRVAEAAVDNEDNPTWGTPGGPATSDRVFLLSQREAAGYLAGQWEVDWGEVRLRGGLGDARLSARDEDGASAWWWLRSPGGAPVLAADVSPGGSLHGGGGPVAAAGGGVRPALWLNLGA